MQTTATVAEPTVEFNATLRCDAAPCGAQARMVALFPNGAQLAFCGHHGRKHRDALEQTCPNAVVISDDA